jgi:hypothetical protein
VFSLFTAATGTNTIDNASFAQEWDWNSLAGANALTLATTSTAAASNAQKMLFIQMTGANATSAQTTYGLDVQNLHTGTTAVNVGIHIKTTGAPTDYPLITEGGFTGLGTLVPAYNLHVLGTSSSIITAEENLSGGFSQFFGKTNNGTGQVEIYALPNNYGGTTGAFSIASAYIRATGTNGLNLGASSGTGVMRFFTNGETLTSERMRLDSVGRLHIDTLAGSSQFNIGGTRADNNPVLDGTAFTVGKGTFTDNNTANSATVGQISISSFKGGIINSFHTSVTYTNASTLYIDSAVKAGANNTITNLWSLFVNTGKSHFGGALQIVDGTQSNGFVLTSDASGNASWQAAGGGAVSSVSNSNGTLTISPITGAVVASLALGHANTWTAVQTQPAPIFTGMTSAGVNDSVMTIDPATGQVHFRAGTIGITYNNLLTSTGGTLVQVGGSAIQNTVFAMGAFDFSITGLPNKIMGSTDSVLIENSAGKLYKTTVTPVKFTETADNTITNSTSNLTMIGTGVGSNTIGANTMAVGQTITVKGFGYLSTAAVAPTLIFTFANSSSSAAITAPTLTTLLNNNPLEWELVMVCRTTGNSGSGSVMINGWVSVGGAKTYIATSGPYVFDTTIGQTIDLQAQFGTASTSNTIVTKTYRMSVQ